MKVFDLPAELTRINAEYVPVVIERHFGPLTICETRLMPGPLPTCSECADNFKNLGWGLKCAMCHDDNRDG